MCVEPKNRKKITKTPYFGVQGHSRSLILTPLRSSSPVFVMISSMSMLNCNHFHARRANSGKMASFRGVPFFRLFVCGDPTHPAAQNTLNYHMVKTRNLYLTWSWNGTRTWQTPRQNYRS